MKNKLPAPVQNGYTIVELLVTLFVGAVLLVALNTVIISQIHLSERTRDLALSSAFAENKIESLRSLGFSGLTDSTSDITSELPTELKKPRTGTLIISTQASGLKKIDITITYNDQGAPRTYSFTTYIGELGVGQ